MDLFEPSVRLSSLTVREITSCKRLSGAAFPTHLQEALDTGAPTRKGQSRPMWAHAVRRHQDLGARSTGAWPALLTTPDWEFGAAFVHRAPCTADLGCVWEADGGQKVEPDVQTVGQLPPCRARVGAGIGGDRAGFCGLGGSGPRCSLNCELYGAGSGN